MTTEYHRVVFVFIDGVGLAPASSDNPLARHSTPTIDDLLGGSLTLERRRLGEKVLLGALDATLGVEGLPQSATGQTALFTGVNAAAEVGNPSSAFLRIEIQEGGDTDTYTFFYKLEEADPWTELAEVNSDQDNARVGMFFKNGNNTAEEDSFSV